MWTPTLRSDVRRILGVPLWLCGFLLLGNGSGHAQSSTDSSGANRIAPSAAAWRLSYTPLTEKDRLKQYFKSTFNPVAFVRSAAAAGIGQWRDTPREWREGERGYRFRYESAFGEHIVKETLQFAGSNILQEDNRFIPSGESGFGTRLKYGISSAFMARHNDGSRHVSISKIAAFAGAALISRRWQPPSTGKLESAEVNLASMWGAAVGFDVLKEFWPRRH